MSVAVTLYTLRGMHTVSQGKARSFKAFQSSGGARAPLAAAPHAHTAARRRRSWPFLRIPLRIPSAPYITQAVEMRCEK